jgi:hypothetical protein
MFNFSVKNITFDSNGNVYVKYPLGNIKYMTKEPDKWKLSQDLPVVFDELERNIGHDLTILKAGNGFVHPYVDTTGTPDQIFNRIYQHQQPYVIGKNDRVYRSVDENGFIWGRYQITNPRAGEYYKYISEHPNDNKEIPLHSSIMLVLNGEQPRDDIKHFRVIHNAVVDDPQFGFGSSMRAICVGNDKQCDQALLAAGSIQCCSDTQKRYKNFFDSLNSYILSAGNTSDMSEQEKPEENGEEGGGEGGKKASTSGNKMPIDTNWKDEVKKYVDESISKINLPSKEETKQPVQQEQKQDIKTDIPQNVIDSIIAKVAEKYDTQIKDLTGKLENQNNTIKSFEGERREQNIGHMLLEYQDFFRGNDGKVDGKLFDENLKYWTAKQGNEEDIKLDLEHSFDIAKKYISNLSLPTEKTAQQVTKESEPLDKRQRIMKEVEDEEMKLGVVQKAGNVQQKQDELENTYQNILSKKGNNDKIVNSNDRIY